MRPRGKERGFSLLMAIALVALIAAIAAVLYFMYLGRSGAGDSNVSPQPDQSQEGGAGGGEARTDNKPTVREDTYVLNLPQGWRKVSEAPTPYLAAFARSGADFYGDGQGNYFMVQTDPPGRGFEADAVWELKVQGDGYAIESKQGCGEGPFCSAGDGNLRIGLKDTGTEQLGGHTYFFLAGNTQKETGVDTQVFEQIISNFKAKSQ